MAGKNAKKATSTSSKIYKKSNKNYKKYNNKKFDKKKTKCFKCGKYGHFANDCKVKQKINQLQINNKEKEDLYNLLELRNTDSENEISPDVLCFHILHYFALYALLPLLVSEPSSSPSFVGGCVVICVAFIILFCVIHSLCFLHNLDIVYPLLLIYLSQICVPSPKQ